MKICPVVTEMFSTDRRMDDKIKSLFTLHRSAYNLHVHDSLDRLNCHTGLYILMDKM
jgi:hypothetical protein